MRPGVIPGTRVEPPAGADRPDGPPPTPDIKLTAGDLKALVKLPAAAASVADTCRPGDVRLSLTKSDAAAGHRYAQLLAMNISGRTCALMGWAGLGFRGVWGTAFPVVAERTTTPVDRVGATNGGRSGRSPSTTGTMLAPGDRATAEFEWTGALAGAREEPVSLIVVQFTKDGPAGALPVEFAAHVDIGPETTVRLGPWAPGR